MPTLKPTPGQLEFLNWEFGVFFHFGIRSFFPGHKDWDQRPMPASAFQPDALDCGQWIRLARDAGARYAILVCKHHDGFANWPSQYTDYSVANTPWKNGRGDVVGEYVAACREYGLKVGLYYSPAQWGAGVSFAKDREYDDYFINQISELLTRYGKIDYLWFDGCGSENHTYDKDRIIAVIRGLQPEILIFSMWDPDTCWVGNEDGYAPMPHPYTRESTNFSMKTARLDSLGGQFFLPAECDCKLRDAWFDCEDNANTIKTVDELLGMYEMSVGRGANFLLNIGPDHHGRLPEADANRLLEFGDALRRRYGHPLPFGPLERAGEGGFSMQAPGFSGDFAGAPGDLPLVNRVILQEDLREGEAALHYRLYAHLPAYQSKRVCVYQGDTIGHKAICVFPAIRTGKITVEIDQSAGDARLLAMTAYFD